MSPKFSVPVSVTLFGNSVFTDIIKLIWGHTKVWGPKSQYDVFIRRGEWYRHPQREESHEDWAETAVMRLKAKECQGLLAATRS